MFFTHRPLEWDEYVEGFMGAEQYAALKLRARQWKGPLDRREVARVLYARAMELEIIVSGLPNAATFAGIYDDESERAERDRNRARVSA